VVFVPVVVIGFLILVLQSVLTHDLHRVAFLLHNELLPLVGNFVSRLVLGERRYFELRKVRLNLAIEQNFLPLGTDALVFHFRHGGADCSCENLMVLTLRNLEGFLDDVVSVRVLN
jgi:hypothetical protein